MKKINKFVPALSLYTIYNILFPSTALAHCPLCVAGAAVGITLTRWIGVDDSITGIWIAALLGSSSFWLTNWVMSKYGDKIKNNLRLLVKPFFYILIFGSTIWSFYKFQLIIRMDQIMGFDKLAFGMLVGGISFYLLDYLKIKRYFPYQKIVINLGMIILLSIFDYILINYYI